MINNPKELLPYQGKLKFYPPIAMLFVSLFIAVNLITQKLVPIGDSLMLTAGDFLYPLSYMLSIILTEVYGYTMSRRVIWTAFVCNGFVAIIIIFSIWLPAAVKWQEQQAYTMILGRTPRILAASFSAFLVGEFIGTYILAKIKVLTLGKYLWFRTLSSTFIGQFIDSITFTVIAFMGILTWHDVIILSITAYWCKIIYQTLLTPAIYMVVRFLKKQEHVDIFDRNTNFNPFNLGLK